MSTKEPLSLLDRFEPPHTPLSHPGRLMGLLSSIILILFCTVDRLWDKFAMSNTIAAQLVCHDFSGLIAVTPQWALEEAFRSNSIPLGLKENIHHFAILVDGSPQVVLLTVYLHKDLIDVEGITITSVLSLQATGINGAEFYTPEADCFSGYSDASLG